MAKQSNVNSIPTTGSTAWYLWISTLVAAGWTHQGGGDGTAFENNGQTAGPYTVITTGASGTGGLGNTNAWVRLSSPSGSREFVLQRSSTDLLWRMFYSKGAGFSTGASATVRPTATDEAECIGDGSGGFTTAMNANGTYRFHVVAEDAATAGGIFGWWVHCTVSGTGAFARFFAYEGLVNAQSSHADKAVFLNPGGTGGGSAPTKTNLRNSNAVRGTNATVYHNATSGNVPKGYYKHDLGGEAFQTYSGCMLGHADLTNTYSAPTLTAGTDGLAQDPYDNAEVEADIVYGRANTQFGGVNPGLKGTGARVRWCTAGYRRYPSVYNRAADARIILHGASSKSVLTAPWPDTVEAIYG